MNLQNRPKTFTVTSEVGYVYLLVLLWVEVYRKRSLEEYRVGRGHLCKIFQRKEVNMRCRCFGNMRCKWSFQRPKNAGLFWGVVSHQQLQKLNFVLCVDSSTLWEIMGVNHTTIIKERTFLYFVFAADFRAGVILVSAFIHSLSLLFSYFNYDNIP